MDRRGAQPADDDRRPPRDRSPARVPNSTSARPRCGSMRAANSRCCNSTTSQVVLQLHHGIGRGASARCTGARRVRAAHRRRPLRRPASGRYRFDRTDTASDLTVYSGQGLFEGPGSALTLYGGQRGEFWIDGNGSAQYSITTPVDDAFAAWNDARDRSEERAIALPYVSPEMTGADELDALRRLGSRPPTTAPVWFPAAVPADWAPYSAGHWAWVRPWGWTWVDDAPWGFAPFHYGRWVRYARPLVLDAGQPASRGRCMRRRWSPGSAARRPARRSRSAAGRWSAGSRWRRARSMCRATTPARAMCARSTSRTSPTSRRSPRSSSTSTAARIRATSRTASSRTRVTVVPASVMTGAAAGRRRAAARSRRRCRRC